MQVTLTKVTQRYQNVPGDTRRVTHTPQIICMSKGMTKTKKTTRNIDTDD